jgi:phosphoglycerol transferase MdoB-like AlkP superfamily enzyme
MMTVYKKIALFLFITLFVFFLSRLGLLLIYRDTFSSCTASSILLSFLDGFRFDLSILLTVTLLPLVMMTQPIKPYQGFRFWGWVFYTVSLLCSLVLTSDLIYFDFVKRHIGREIFVLGNDWSFIFQITFRSFRIPLVLFIVFSCLLFFLWKKILAVPLLEVKKTAVKWLLFLIILFAGIRGSYSGKSINIIDAFCSGDTMQGNLTLNGLFSLCHSSSETKQKNPHFYSKTEVQEILQLKPDEYPMTASLAASQSHPNVVFVLMESWSFKYVDSFSGSHYGVTPCFDSLAGEGKKYLQFYSAGQRSLEGIQTTLTGIPVLPGIPYLGYGLETMKFSHLGELAKKNGYQTLFVQSFRRRSYRMDSIAHTLGFNEYYGMEDIPLILDYPDPGASQYGWDYETWQFLKKKLDAASGPFFAYFCTGATHGPYPLAGKQFEKYPHTPNGEGGFLNSLYYADWSLGEFMKAARSSKWFTNTIFIFTADHPLGSFQGSSLLDKFHIPLLIYAPGLLKPETINTVGSHLDIMPTILDFLGVSDEFSAAGESLLQKKRDWIFMTEGDLVAVLTNQGYLKHSLKNRLETGSFKGKMPDTYFDTLEKKLLAFVQLSYELIQNNKWAK